MSEEKENFEPLQLKKNMFTELTTALRDYLMNAFLKYSFGFMYKEGETFETFETGIRKGENTMKTWSLLWKFEFYTHKNYYK